MKARVRKFQNDFPIVTFVLGNYYQLLVCFFQFSRTIFKGDRFENLNSSQLDKCWKKSWEITRDKLSEKSSKDHKILVEKN